MAFVKTVQPLKKEERIFPELPDQKGIKIEKVLIENLFIVYLGTDNGIDEIVLCQKKVNTNNQTIFHELISGNNYQISSEVQPQILKAQTLLSALNIEAYSKSKENLKTILKQGYLTIEDIITINSLLNEDHAYETEYYSRGNGPVYYDCPTFLKRYKNSKCVMEKDDDNLKQLILKLTTSYKIPILNGDKGIGKSTFINKLNYFIIHQSSYFTNKELWKINYQDLIKNTITTKHIENRIKKTLKFLEKQPDSILFIDDVDFDDNLFIQKIKENGLSSKTKIVLIPKNKINEDSVDQDTFTVINSTHQKENTQRQIIKDYIKDLKIKTKMSLNFQPDEEEELITILLNSSKTNSLNNNYDNNPKLAKMLLEDTFKVASAYHQNEVFLYNFQYAIFSDNLKIAKDALEDTYKSLNLLETKVNARKKEEENKKKPVTEKIKNLFKKRNKRR